MTTKHKLSDMTGYEADEVMIVQGEEYETLKAINAELLAALKAIIENATIAPDGTMSGSTDIYTVPFDDIEAAKTIVAKAEGR